MEWMAPMTGLAAAAIAVPLLVLLYFLKLKRREVFVSSTLLWKRAVQDLQVNAPFQRLRRNILLLLQLLALVALLTALAAPVLSLRGGPERRVVLLIDRSASMNATDADGTSRLAQARRLAKDVVRSLRGAGAFSLWGRTDQAMVIAFDEHAKVMCSFTADQSQLLKAVDAIEPTDAESLLGEAVLVARAYALPPGEDAGSRAAAAGAQLELFSDGRIRDLAQVVVGPGEVNFHRVGASADNVALVAMEARRSYEHADEVNVFASLANSGDAQVSCDVQLSIDGSVRAVRPVALPPCAVDAKGQRTPGKAAVSFLLKHSAAGVIEVRQLRPDALASDDAAWAVLPPPRKLSVLLVTGGNLALTAALQACPLARLDIRAPAEFAASGSSALAEGSSALAEESQYDVVVLDNVVPGELPRGAYLIFGSPPPGIGVSSPAELKDQLIVDWRARHSVLQHVKLGSLYAAKCRKLVLPRDATVLSEFNDTPAMAVVQRQGGVFLLVGFDVNQTNWPFDPGFVMFCYNAMNYLGLELGQGPQSSLAVGQAITVQGKPADKTAEVFGPGTPAAPGGPGTTIECDGSGAFRFPRTLRAGVYRVEVAGRAPVQFAVNLLNEAESDIKPAGELVLAGQAVAASPAGSARTNRELWPLLVGLCLLVVCIEWFVYNSRVRL